MSNETKDLTKEAYEQNWLHGRHVENERLWFTTIYGAITTGIYTILGEGKFAFELYPLLIVHIILSVFGLVIALKLSAEFHRHNEIANRILEQFNPEFALRPIESTTSQRRYFRYTRQIFTVKNSFFQIYVILLVSSAGLLLGFYPEIFSGLPFIGELGIPIEVSIIILLIILEVVIAYVYGSLLKAKICFVKCKECGKVVRFDDFHSPKRTVRCGKCKTEMQRIEQEYLCSTCGNRVAFDVKRKKVQCIHKDYKVENQPIKVF